MPIAVRDGFSRALTSRNGSRNWCKAKSRPRMAKRCSAQPGDRLSRRIHNTDKKAKVLAVDKKDKSGSHSNGSQFLYYFGGAILLGGVIGGLKGFQAAEEYYAGYLLEQCLSVDNLFVFMLCFSFFKTPPELQDRALSIGIWSAAALRLIIILAGVELVDNFKPLLLVFAAILLYSSYGLLFAEDDDAEEDLSDNVIVKAINKVFTVTPDYRGDRFFIKEDDILKVTPLFVVLAVIEISDVIFAVDSIPAVFGVTLDPVVVYTSNIAAILSLRSLYGFVATVIAELRFLEKSVSVILAFIGGKMILDQVPGGYHVSTEQSLLFVAATLGVGVAASLLLPEENTAMKQNLENGASPVSLDPQEMQPQIKGKKDKV